MRILEIGAGIGTMIERLVEWRLIDRAEITAIDADAAAIAEARRRLPDWARAATMSLTQASDGTSTLADEQRTIRVSFEAIDLMGYVARHQASARPAYDLLIAHAVLDLLDLTSTLPHLIGLVRPAGLLYLTINFDGGTILQPEIDRPFDDLVEARYHQTMDERLTAGRPSGDSRTGRHLFAALRAHGAWPVAAGSSDWVVLAGADGYLADERFFLQFIVQTIHGALTDDPAIDQDRLAAWIAERQAQIERGELVYIAHQIDLLARTSD